MKTAQEVGSRGVRTTGRGKTPTPRIREGTLRRSTRPFQQQSAPDSVTMSSVGLSDEGTRMRFGIGAKLGVLASVLIIATGTTMFVWMEHAQSLRNPDGSLSPEALRTILLVKAAILLVGVLLA